MYRLPQRTTGIPIREPGGRVIASVVEEAGERVLIRNVREKERFRNLDGWPLGEQAAAQAKEARVTRLRYLAREGRYETHLGIFLEKAYRLPFAHETQYVLPRKAWSFTPKGSQQLSLLAAAG